MKIAIFPGSFDPFTKGHSDILSRAVKIFDKIIVCIMENPEKNPYFSIEQKVEIIQKYTKCYKNVSVESYQGLLVDFAEKNDANCIVKGIRNAVDMDNESNMQEINQYLNPLIETVFFISKNENKAVSSTAVRQLIKLNADFSQMLCDDAFQYISNLKE